MRKWIFSAVLMGCLCSSGCFSCSSGEGPATPVSNVTNEPESVELSVVSDPDSASNQDVHEDETTDDSLRDKSVLADAPENCIDTTSTLYQAWFKAVLTRTDGAWMLYALRLADAQPVNIAQSIDIIEKLKAHETTVKLSDIYDYHLGRLWAIRAEQLSGDEKTEALKNAYAYYLAVSEDELSPYVHEAKAEYIKVGLQLGADARLELQAFINEYPTYPGVLNFRFEEARLSFELGDKLAGTSELQDLAWLYPWSDVSTKAQTYMDEHGISSRERSYDEIYNRVNELRRMRFWDEAETAAQEAVQLYPEKYQLLVLYARIAYERSDHALAAQRFEKILEMLNGETKDKLRPQGVIAYLYRAYAYMGDTEKALEYFNRNLEKIDKASRTKAKMDFALSSGVLEVAWENAKIYYQDKTSASDIAKFGFIAYLNGFYEFARKKFAEAESGLSGVEKRRLNYFMAQATLKAAQNIENGIVEPAVDAPDADDGSKKSKKDKKSKKTKKKEPSKKEIKLVPATTERALLLFRAMISSDSSDYYAILANTRIAEIERKESGESAPETPVFQTFGEIEQNPAPYRPWEVEYTFDEKQVLSEFGAKAAEYRTFLPELERVAFLHEAELYKERNALFRVITFEIMGVSRMSKRPTAQNLWTSGLSVGGHLVDNRKNETGVWGMKPKRDYFELPGKKDTAARQKIAARQGEIYDRGGELRAFVRSMLLAFHDYYLGRRYSPSIHGVCGSDANLNDCSMMYPHAFSSAVIKASKENHISPDLIWTLMNIESAFNPDSVSVAQAYGLLQIIPVTGYKLFNALERKDLGPYDLIAPEVSISMGTWYFAQVLHKFRGYATLSMAGYNGGPHQVARWLTAYAGKLEHDAFIELIPYVEARNYVKKGMARMLIFYRIDRHDPKAFFEIPNTLPDGFEEMPNY